MFDTTIPGEYTFAFANFNTRSTQTVTLALHTYEENKAEPVSYDFDDQGQRVQVGRATQTQGEGDTQAIKDILEENEDEITQEVIINNLRNILGQAHSKAKSIKTESSVSLERQNMHN